VERMPRLQIFAPNREHTVSIGVSAHLYLKRSGGLRWQARVLDPRLDARRKRLARLHIRDVGTGVFYAELHEFGSNVDLLGFLARAWSTKAWHPMRGLPGHLNLPALATSDARLVGDLRALELVTNISTRVDHVDCKGNVRSEEAFDRQMGLLPTRGEPFLLGTAQELSARVSNQVCHAECVESMADWSLVSEMPPAFRDFMDGLYREHGAWRSGPWASVVAATDQGHQRQKG